MNVKEDMAKHFTRIKFVFSPIQVPPDSKLMEVRYTWLQSQAISNPTFRGAQEIGRAIINSKIFIITHLGKAVTNILYKYVP